MQVTLTVVTTHLHDFVNLARTIKSVQQQTAFVTHLVIDAGTDGITDFVDKIGFFNSKNNRLIVKKGCSVEEGQNIGIDEAVTEFFHILNCGTTYKTPDSLRLALNKIDGSYLGYAFAAEIVWLGRKSVVQTPKLTRSITLMQEASILKKTNFRHPSHYGGDAFLMADYYPQIACFPSNILVVYEKGGISDTQLSLFFRLVNYYKISIIFYKKNAFKPIFFIMIRCFKDIALELVKWRR